MFFLILLMLFQPVQAQARTFVSDPASVCMDATQKFEKEYQIKEHLLTTIASVETGRWDPERKQNRAWPWTINAQGKGMFFKTKAEAVREVKRLQKAGVKSIDVGCMQINLAYHGDAFASVEEALDPEKNVEYSAKFLKSLYASRDNDWIKAAMAYHSSSPKKALRYKKKIVTAYEKVKQAYNASQKLFADNKTNERAKNDVNKKLIADAKGVKYGKTDLNKDVRKSAKSRINAQEWREAKLAEYRRNKTR